jgi:hypothetical protein
MEEVYKIFDELEEDEKEVYVELLSDEGIVTDLIAFYQHMKMCVEEDPDAATPEDVIEGLTSSRCAEENYGSFGVDVLHFIFEKKKEKKKENSENLENK